MSYFRCLQQIKAQYEMVTNVKIFTSLLHTLFKLNALFIYFLVSKKTLHTGDLLYILPSSILVQQNLLG